MSKLPVPLVTSTQKNIWQLKHKYLCTVDRDHRHRHSFIGDDSKEYELFLPKWLSANHREAHPNIGTIVSTSENAQFSVGQQIFCRHFSFEDHHGEPTHVYKEDGVLYYLVNNFDVLAAIDKDKLIPREGIVFCTAIRE